MGIPTESQTHAKGEASGRCQILFSFKHRDSARRQPRHVEILLESHVWYFGDIFHTCASVRGGVRCILRVHRVFVSASRLWPLHNLLGLRRTNVGSEQRWWRACSCSLQPRSWWSRPRAGSSQRKQLRARSDLASWTAGDAKYVAHEDESRGISIMFMISIATYRISYNFACG